MPNTCLYGIWQPSRLRHRCVLLGCHNFSWRHLIGVRSLILSNVLTRYFKNRYRVFNGLLTGKRVIVTANTKLEFLAYFYAWFMVNVSFVFQKLSKHSCQHGDQYANRYFWVTLPAPPHAGHCFSLYGSKGPDVLTVPLPLQRAHVTCFAIITPYQ